MPQQQFGPFILGEQSPDLPRIALPAGAIYNGRNVEWSKGAIRKRPGINSLCPTALTDAPFLLKEFLLDNGTLFLVAADASSASYYDSTLNALTDITPSGGISGDATIPAEATVYRNKLYCTWDSAEGLQVWDGNGLFVGATNAFQCRYVNCLVDHLVTANYTISGTRFPQSLKWATIGDPTTWDIGTATDAGENYRSDPPGWITGLIRIGDYLYVAREYSWERMTHVGPPDIFVFETLTGVAGMWAPKSYAMTITNQEPLAFYRGNDTLYQFNGIVSRPLPDEARMLLNAYENPARARYSVGGIWPSRHQYWLSFSSGASDVNDMTLVYDYLANSLWVWPVGFASMATWQSRSTRTWDDLDAVLTAIDPSHVTMDHLDEVSATADGLDGASGATPLVFALGQQSGKVGLATEGALGDDTAVIAASFETALTACSFRGDGVPYQGPKDFGRLFLEAERAGGRLGVTLGTSEDGVNISWGALQTLDLTQTQRSWLDFRQAGRYVSLRFSNASLTPFGFITANLDWTPRPNF